MRLEGRTPPTESRARGRARARWSFVRAARSRPARAPRAGSGRWRCSTTASAPLASSKCRPWRMPPSSSPWPTRTRSTRSDGPARRSASRRPRSSRRCCRSPRTARLPVHVRAAGALVHEAFDRDGLDSPAGRGRGSLATRSSRRGSCRAGLLARRRAVRPQSPTSAYSRPSSRSSIGSRGGCGACRPRRARRGWSRRSCTSPRARRVRGRGPRSG